MTSTFRLNCLQRTCGGKAALRSTFDPLKHFVHSRSRRNLRELCRKELLE